MSTLKVGTIQDHANSNTAISITSAGVVTQPNKIIFRAFMDSSVGNQSIGSGGNVKVTLNATQFNIGNCYATGTGKFTPTVAGYYNITWQARVDSSTPDFVLARIFKNGSLHSDSRATESNAANSYPSAVNNSIIHMNGSGDYLEFYTYHNVGSAVNFSAGNDVGWAQGYLIG